MSKPEIKIVLPFTPLPWEPIRQEVSFKLSDGTTVKGVLHTGWKLKTDSKEENTK